MKRTLAWGAGGYYARVFVNLKGRDPEGALPPDAFEDTRCQIESRLTQWCIDKGLASPLFRRPDLDYRAAHGFPPDLMIYFEDLALRSLGTVGHASVLQRQNDLGQDGCNHDWDGIFIGVGDSFATGCTRSLSIFDVTPTLLSVRGLPTPRELLGTDRTLSAGSTQATQDTFHQSVSK